MTNELAAIEEVGRLQAVNNDLVAALEALTSWQDKLSLSDRHATADQARAWSLDCRCARVLIIRAKNGPK